MLVFLAGCTVGLAPLADTDPAGETDARDTDRIDTSETGDTGAIVPTGLTGGLLEMTLLQIACPDCFGATSDLAVSADFVLNEPAYESWVDRYPASGGCVANPAGNPPLGLRYDVGEWVYLTSGSTSIGLHRSIDTSGTTYLADGLDNADFHRTAQYAVQVGEGGPEIPAFEQQNAVLTPQGFASITPAELLFVDATAAFAARIRKSQTNAFTWADSGGNGDFIVDVQVYNPQGTALLADIMCRGPDNGALSIPGNVFASFPTGSLLAVYMYRLQLGEFVLAANGSTVQTVATVGVLGTGKLAN